jgi:hypothetical protein
MRSESGAPCAGAAPPPCWQLRAPSAPESVTPLQAARCSRVDWVQAVKPVAFAVVADACLAAAAAAVAAGGDVVAHASAVAGATGAALGAER